MKGEISHLLFGEWCSLLHFSLIQVKSVRGKHPHGGVHCGRLHIARKSGRCGSVPLQPHGCSYHGHGIHAFWNQALQLDVHDRQKRGTEDRLVKHSKTFAVFDVCRQVFLL